MDTLTKIYTYENDFKEYVEAVNAGLVCRIDENIFDYFLEVLPPVYMDKIKDVEIDGVKYPKRCSFGFAEGWEAVIDFWRADGAYYAKKSKRLNPCL